jgi:hypothetical protein
MKMLKEAGAGGRVLVNAIQLDGPAPTEVNILELAPTAFKAIIDICLEWEEAGQSIFDISTGKDILITRSGTGLLTKYTVQIAALAKPIPADVLSKLHNLDEYVNQESSEQQLRALNSVRSVTGLLPAPSHSGLPGAVAALGAATIEEDPYAVAAPPPKRITAPVEDAVVKPAAVAPVAAAVAPKPVAAVKPAPVAVAAAVEEGSGDAELDDLLASLG